MEILTIGLLALIATETSFLSYRAISNRQSAKKQSIFVDTSALIDGRIVDVVKAGFIVSELVIPRSVIAELQFLADKGDTDKREKARKGLDIVKVLQDNSDVDVRILADGRATTGVDDRLLDLAKKYNGRLLTVDYNLNKVAQVDGIVVLNINELAKNLRIAYLPGDKITIELTQAGSDQHQAIGHLEDGTMVVVEHAKSMINKQVNVEVIRSLQTAAGRMIFARLVDSRLRNNSDKTNDKMRPKQSPGRRPIVAKAVKAKSTKSNYQTRRPSSKERESSMVDLANS